MDAVYLGKYDAAAHAIALAREYAANDLNTLLRSPTHLPNLVNYYLQRPLLWL